MSDQLVAEAATYTTHNRHKRQTFVPSVGFKSTIPATEQLQIHALGATTTGIILFHVYYCKYPV